MWAQQDMYSHLGQYIGYRWPKANQHSTRHSPTLLQNNFPWVQSFIRNWLLLGTQHVRPSSDGSGVPNRRMTSAQPPNFSYHQVAAASLQLATGMPTPTLALLPASAVNHKPIACAKQTRKLPIPQFVDNLPVQKLISIFVYCQRVCGLKRKGIWPSSGTWDTTATRKKISPYFNGYTDILIYISLWVK